ncbi:MAG TPA: class I SAM-dependent methyltransferase [Saprospiraceae bacterium]|nr:class I SAM-dependent methyltransferase [Saprospiraceae bacterium]
MYDYHADKIRYFEMQYLTSRDFIIPFIEAARPLRAGDRILEIGCAEAGVLKAFIERDLFCFGIDLNPQRIDTAIRFQQEAYDLGKIKFISKNIYDINIAEDLGGAFDIILMKDVIEHIPDQERFIPALQHFLRPGGVVFFGFPPWQMPFGGHQQMVRSRWLGKWPWVHLLPRFLYRGLLKISGQEDVVVRELLEIKDTGISIERFEKIVSQSPFWILSKKFYLTNPIYKFKFDLEPRKVPNLFSSIPYFRNYFTTAAYYLIGYK